MLSEILNITGFIFLNIKITSFVTLPSICWLKLPKSWFLENLRLRQTVSCTLQEDPIYANTWKNSALSQWYDVQRHVYVQDRGRFFSIYLHSCNSTFKPPLLTFDQKHLVGSLLNYLSYFQWFTIRNKSKISRI